MKKRFSFNHTTSSFKKQCGFDLIQLSIVTAIIGVLIAGSIQIMPNVLQSTKLNREITDLALVHSRLKDIFGEGPIKTIGGPELIKLGAVPDEWVLNTTSILSRLSTQTGIETKPTENEFLVKLIYSPKNCVSVVQGAKGIFNHVKIGSTKLAENGKLIGNNLFTQCASGTNDKEVIFVFKP